LAIAIDKDHAGVPQQATILGVGHNGGGSIIISGDAVLVVTVRLIQVAKAQFINTAGKAGLFMEKAMLGSTHRPNGMEGSGLFGTGYLV
jgi:hypothetical protein